MYPADLEDLARGCHSSIRPGGVAAFSVENDPEQGEEVVLYLELDKRKYGIGKHQMQEICMAAQQAVIAHYHFDFIPCQFE